MKLILAIIWSAYLVSSILQMAAGVQPSWLSVFCPLICLTAQRWDDYLDWEEEQYEI